MPLRLRFSDALVAASLSLGGIALGCAPTEGSTGGPGLGLTMPGSGEPSVGDEGSTSSDGTSTSAGTSSSSSSSSTTQGATGEATTDDSGPASSGEATTIVYDVDPTVADLGDGKPAGCKGKIDFLFVISRGGVMKTGQERLLNAFPKFIATIESRFADFDFHIMAIDGDGFWGSVTCDAKCDEEGVCDLLPEYPCDLRHLVTECDRTMGAGNLFNAGGAATNKPCSIAGGRRYLTKDDPNLTEAFTCVAKVGISGLGYLGEAVTAAMKPAINAPGGCNAGFLRDDALLMITFIGNYDFHSKDDPGTWSANILKAKGGDPRAVVMLSILDPVCPPEDRICELLKKYPYHWVGDIIAPNYGEAFSEAAGLVELACAEYIPR